MTEAGYRQMLADRDAGTPGPWAWDNEWMIGPGPVCEILTDTDYHVTPAESPEDSANARRIARVPDLEAEVIRLRELVQRATDLIEGDLVGAEWKRECKAFVRDAKGGD